MSKTNICLTFIFGAVIGSYATYKYMVYKYESEMTHDSENNAYDTEYFEKGNHSKTNEEIFHSKLKECGYLNKEEDKSMKKPYVISPDKFGENEDYEQISLTYYSDGVLADDNDNLMMYAEEIVGEDALNHFGEYGDALNHFGEYEDDSVFVRNDNLKCDYEILWDSRKYSDVLADMPYKNM